MRAAASAAPSKFAASIRPARSGRSGPTHGLDTVFAVVVCPSGPLCTHGVTCADDHRLTATVVHHVEGHLRLVERPSESAGPRVRSAAHTSKSMATPDA